MCHSQEIRRIGYYTIYGIVRNTFQRLQAILVIYLVCNHCAFIHELILFHCGKGVSIGATNIIDNIRSFASGAKLVEGEKVHPTQKPVALIRKLIEDSTRPGDLILDTFGGSGTTAVAAIESGRNFVLMEQDEIYYFTAQKRIKDAYERFNGGG